LTKWQSNPASRQRLPSSSNPRAVMVISSTPALEYASQPYCDFVPAHPRYGNVDQDHIRLVCLCRFHRCRTSESRFNLMPVEPEQEGHGLGIVQGVIHHQHSQSVRLLQETVPPRRFTGEAGSS
jgi:hypothetical protein